MSQIFPSSAQLRYILSLLEKKEAIEAELVRFESEFSGLQGWKPAGKPQEKLFKRGALRNEVLKVLKKAGKAGASVDDIAKAIGAKKSNLSVWFTRNSRKIKGIHKVRRCVYALRTIK